MSWVVCPRCHFSQISAERCRRCGETLALPSGEQAPASSARRPFSRTGKWLAAAAAAVLLAGLYWLGRPGRSAQSIDRAPTPHPTSGTIDLSGRWRGQISKIAQASPPRPVLKEISIETGRDGAILAARVVFTDPGRGGAGAGYRIAPDGPRRLGEAAAALAGGPKGAPLSIDFLQLPAWVPERARLWRALEGSGPGAESAHYLLVESLETDYLIQAGINESGFLSFAFFSPLYAPARGQDVLSRVIHPEPEASLRGFRNLVWDLSGAADFLTFRLPVTLSDPGGGTPDSVVLTR